LSLIGRRPAHRLHSLVAAVSATATLLFHYTCAILLLDVRLVIELRSFGNCTWPRAPYTVETRGRLLRLRTQSKVLSGSDNHVALFPAVTFIKDSMESASLIIVLTH